jgi:thioredoxin family protein
VHPSIRTRHRTGLPDSAGPITRWIDGNGNPTVTHQRVYQLLRQPGPITDRTFEITFLDTGVQAYSFTFG